MNLARSVLEELSDKDSKTVGAELAGKWDGKDVKGCEFKVEINPGLVTLSWEIKARGMTHETALYHNLELIQYANRILAETSSAYSDCSLAEVHPLTLEVANKMDAELAQVSGNALGDQEITLCGYIELKFGQ